MARFLCAYDYGQGAVWLYLEASSKTRVADLYPELAIVPQLPEWMSEEEADQIAREMTFDAEQPTGVLQVLIDNRAL